MMLRKTLTAVSLVAGLTATTALADGEGMGEGVPSFSGPVYEVTMLGLGFFPDTLYADPSGAILFYNASALSMTAVAEDGSWTTGSILPGETFFMELTQPDGTVLDGAYANAEFHTELVGTAQDSGDTIMDTTTASGQIIVGEEAKDLMAASTPMTQAQIDALYGAPSHDTDGDGDVDGHDWQVLLKESDGSSVPLVETY